MNGSLAAFQDAFVAALTVVGDRSEPGDGVAPLADPRGGCLVVAVISR
ncbi:hypothetical protein SSTU70S_00506 [Stutzerimonas stutzeri]